MTEITEFTIRTLDQEIDALEIIPDHPDFVIIGTYNLQRKDGDGADSSQGGHDDVDSTLPLRSGSLQIIHWNATDGEPSEINAHNFGRRDFPCAIVDLHFHPVDKSLLAVATSAAEVRFFRVVPEHGTEDEGEQNFHFRIIDLGVAVISGPDDSDTLPLITYFDWFPQIVANGEPGIDETLTITLAATDSLGVSKIIRTSVLGVRSVQDARLQSRIPQQEGDNVLEVESFEVHKTMNGLGIESWFITTFPIDLLTSSARSEVRTPGEAEGVNQEWNKELDHIVLSGGDDNTLFATEVNFSSHPPQFAQGLAESTPDVENNTETISPTTESPSSIMAGPATRHFTNKRMHTAGIISIHPLLDHDLLSSYSLHTNNDDDEGTSTISIPVLTGSYDDHLRLIMLVATIASSSPSADGANEHDPSDSKASRLSKFTPHEVISIHLDGSPWRIIPFASYTTVSSTSSSPASISASASSTHENADTNNLDHRKEHHHLFLICCMYAGAKIIRVVYAFSPSSGSMPQQEAKEEEEIQGKWQIREEATLTKPHESMVYAGAIRPFFSSPSSFPSSSSSPSLSLPLKTDDEEEEKKKTKEKEGEKKTKKKYEILTTSFYDKKVVNWIWEDPLSLSPSSPSSSVVDESFSC